jgi:hypothetical protein
VDAQQFPRPVSEAEPALVNLVYELLDAHQDTVRFGAENSADPYWQAHVSYLRDLQRIGKETVARLASGYEETS